MGYNKVATHYRVATLIRPARIFIIPAPMSKSEVARQLGVSRAYVTMLSQGKRRLSEALQYKLGRVFYTQKVRGSSALSPTINIKDSLS